MSAPYRRGLGSALLIAALATTGGCNRLPVPDDTRAGGAVVETRFQMGTLVRIAVVAPDSPQARSAIADAFAAIDAVVAVMSEWDPDSDISRVNAAAGGAPVTVDPSLLHVLSIAEAVSEASAGAFDVTWAPLRHVWCFDPGCTLPDQDALAAALALVDHDRVAVDEADGTVRLEVPGMEVGLGGIAKGFAVARAASALRDAGFADFVVDAGGDVFAAGTNAGAPWHVAVAHPRGGPPVQVVALRDRAIVTSGDYERFIEVDGRRYHHIIDVRTGMPASGLVQVSVISADPTVADALATAAFVLGPDLGLALLEQWPDAEGLLYDGALEARTTSGWPRGD